MLIELKIDMLKRMGKVYEPGSLRPSYVNAYQNNMVIQVIDVDIKELLDKVQGANDAHRGPENDIQRC